MAEFHLAPFDFLAPGACLLYLNRTIVIGNTCAFPLWQIQLGSAVEKDPVKNHFFHE